MPLLNAVIDLSHHNTVTSFQEVKEAGILGVIHKATEGTTFVDSQFDSRRRQALAAGLFWGAYHFGVSGDAEGQADHFLNIVNPDPTDLLVLDFEPNPREGDMTLAEAEAFVSRINDQVGRFPGFIFRTSVSQGPPWEARQYRFKNCFLWIARYSSQLPQVPAAFPTFTLWQYTDGNNGPQPHQVQGIRRCDKDKFNGDEAGLRKLWGQPSI
jgi:lysozyme